MYLMCNFSSMARIGILTFHNNENRGAILQAFGVCELLENYLNTDAEIIEYRTAAKESSRKRSLFATKRPNTILNRIRDRQIVEEFFETHLRTSEDSIITDNHEEAVAWLQEQEYDLLVTGSDEVWKISEEGNKLGSFLFPSRPFPNLYFLDEALPQTKLSYAASANMTKVDALPENKIEMLRKHLRSYDYISVRDSHTKRIIEDLNIGEVTQVPDPTLMIDIPTPCVERLLKKHDINLDEPILNIHAPDVPIFEQLSKEYRDRGYQIVTTRTSPYADIEFHGVVDPFEYFSLYQHFDLTITSSLHSTIFSLKHAVPFATIDVNTTYQDVDSKTYSLLKDFDLLERHIDAVNSDKSVFYEQMDKIEQPLDQAHINSRTEALQKQGYAFLDQIKAEL